MTARVTLSGAGNRREALAALRHALEWLEGDEGTADFEREFEVVAPARPPVTARQAEILSAIRAHRRAHGCAPTQRELCRMLSLVSTNGLNEHLARLAKKGYLTVVPRLARGIRLVE